MRSLDRNAILFWGPSILYGFLAWWFGRGWYFHFDDWTFVGSRREVLVDSGFADFVLLPHNEHLMAGYAAWHHAMAETFRLDSTAPWTFAAIAVTIVVARIARSGMVRIGVGATSAAIVAPILIIWAPSRWALVWPPETVFTLVTGLVLAQLLLVTHDDPVGRRDVGGALVGTLAMVMHSAASIGGIVVVGSLLIRRRFVAALVASTPLLIVGLWLVTFGRRDSVWFVPPGDIDPRTMFTSPVTPRSALEFFVSVLSTPLGWLVGGPLGAVIVVALVIAGLRASRSGDRLQRALASALTAWAALLLVALTVGRAQYYERAPGIAVAGRYAVSLTLLVLPVVALAIQSAAERASSQGRSRTVTGTAAVLGSLVVVLNVVGSRHHLDEFRRASAPIQPMLTELAGHPRLDDLPGETGFLGPFVDLNVEHLRRLRDDRLIDARSDPSSDEYLNQQARYFVRGEPSATGDRPAVLELADGTTAESDCTVVALDDDGFTRVTVTATPELTPRAVSISDGAALAGIRAIRDGRRSSRSQPSLDTGPVELRVLVDAGIATELEFDAPAEICSIES
ncbi:hypothetical protein BH23ACT3_BH23ACT3_01420 [soil metagenome]